MDRICRICHNASGNTPYTVREMLFGTRDEFGYFQCAQCGCLQIAEIPANLGDYYPPGYFSFRDFRRLSASPLRGFFDRQRVRYELTGRGAVGRIAAFLAKPLDYVRWVKKCGASERARVLDVGCGSGKLLLRMRLGGFTHCTGMDAFVPHDIIYPNGVRVLKRDIRTADDTAGAFDLIMFHHSFEHVDDPHAVMRCAARLLAERGCLLIRIPVADSVAWELYRENWAHLDAPRHLYLHTRKSMELLAAAAGLAVADVEHDSTPSQFIASELYIRDIPAVAPRNRKRIFSRARVKEFAARAALLNRQGRGDLAVFYLTRSSP